MPFKRSKDKEGLNTRIQALENIVSLYEKELKNESQSSMESRCIRYSDDIYFTFCRNEFGPVTVFYHNGQTRTRCSVEEALNAAKKLVEEGQAS